MNFITSILSHLRVLQVENTAENKVRLAKQSTKEDDIKKVLSWYLMNSNYFALAAILIFLGIFIVVCFKFCGVSAVESGTMRNFINGGVI